MPCYVATDQGLGRLAADDTIALLDVEGTSLDDAFRRGLSADALAAPGERASVARADVQLLAPVRHPGRMWAVGFAYADHASEVGRDAVDEDQFVFVKSPGSIVGPGDDIRLPALAPERVAYEREIAVVIGRAASEVDRTWPGSMIVAFCSRFGTLEPGDVLDRD